jgi:hypothetical protein
MRALYTRAQRRANLCDPLVGLYSEREVLTIAVPTTERRDSPVRYKVHVLTDVDIRRDSPRRIAQCLREVLGRRPRRCAAAMDLSGVFMETLSSDRATRSDHLFSASELVTQPMPAPACGVIAAKASVVRRWRTLAHCARLDLDILTAGPVAVLTGLTAMSGSTQNGYGVLLIRYDDMYLLCLCRGGSILTSNVQTEEGISRFCSLLRDWARHFQCTMTWGAVVGASDTVRGVARMTLEGALSHSVLSVQTLLSQSIANEAPTITPLNEVSIASSIGLASLGCGV